MKAIKRLFCIRKLKLETLYTISFCISFIKKELASMYPETEIRGFIRMLFDSYAGLSVTDLFLKGNEPLPEVTFQQITDAIGQLKNHRPIQYIIGKAHFYGLDFEVNENVLVPRPETEELVRWVINENKSQKRPSVLDIGTGSGCIAIALKKDFPQAEVFAMDISEEALNVSQRNAGLNNADIHFILADILSISKSQTSTPYDIIVSNPPYVCQSEKRHMQANVLNYEPSQALYVPDEDALVFYRAITGFSLLHLKPGGKLYFEINERFGMEISDHLKLNGFNKIILQRDFQGKNRMIRAIR